MTFTPLQKQRALFKTNRPYKRTWISNHVDWGCLAHTIALGASAYGIAKLFLWLVQ